MKLWFKYKHGFINIDDDFLYLTNTGNWSEIADMKEKGESNSSDFRKYRMIGFLAVCFFLFAFLIYKNINSGNINLLLLIGLPALFFLAYRSLSPEMGSKFKIPHYKMKRLETDGQNVTVHFLNKMDAPSSERILRLDENGIQSIQELMKKRE